MSLDIIKNKSKSHTLETITKIYATLSDRLRRAGIKENKPKCQGKGCKHKNCKKKKAQHKKGYSKEYMSNGFQRNKKLQTPLCHFVTPYIYKSIHEDRQGDVPPKTSGENIAEDVQSTGKETIFASLDFIEDCHNYKKKVRKPKDGQRKTVRSISSIQKHAFQKLFTDNNLDKEENLEDNIRDTGDPPEQKDRIEEINNKSKALYEAVQLVQPFPKELSLENIAKIDKKYLDSILSFTAKMEGKKKGSEDESDTQPETKKKLTGKDFFERKIKTKELQDECLRQNSSGAFPEEWKDALDSSFTDARVVRDLTKSEEQIKLKKGKNLFDTYNTQMKTKNTTSSKPDINDINRKKRKPRNKFMKNNATEFIETSLPSEVSKVADVKEIWRRKTLLKKSENSLTSHSSCTVPESDDYSGSKSLESYRVLRKLVEEGIRNIAKKSENKDNTGEMKPREQNSGNPKQFEHAKKPPPCGKTNELSILKRRLLQAQGKLEGPQMLNFFSEDIPKEANPKLVSVEEKTRTGAKLPSKVIESWSILNRLEQAFVVLGTPTFPDKNPKCALKSKPFSPEGAEKLLADRLKESKRNQKYRDMLAKRENKASPNRISSQKNSPKSTKKPEISINTDLAKEQNQANKAKKISKPEPPPETPKSSKPEEQSSRHQKKKIQSPVDRSLSRKTSLKAMTSSSKKKTNETQMYTSSRTRLYLKAKPQSITKKKPSNQKKKSEENLERKRTFSVIPGIDESINQPRKSKSCGINDGTVEKRFSPTKSQEPKIYNVFSVNLKEDPILRNRSSGNDAGVKIKLTPPPPPPKTVENQVTKTTGSLKNIGQNETSMKGNKVTILSDSKIMQKKEDQAVGKAERIEALLQPMKSALQNAKDGNTASGKHCNNNTEENIVNDSSANPLRERAVKKRSILSVHLDQPSDQTTRMLQKIQEKDVSLESPTHNSKNVDTIHQEVKTNFSNASVISTSTYELVDTSIKNYFVDNASAQGSSKDNEKLEVAPRLTISSVENSAFSDLDDPHNEGLKTRKQPLWEQDITHYRTIVREIMSQYKRIDGFLKQNGQFDNFSSSGTYVVNNDEDEKLVIEPQELNIHEYRKKIISEYKELPIFEYKSKLEQNKEGSSLDSPRKRNLTVVKDYNTEYDVDVKDYQPQVQRVLDSQLYVDAEKLIKRSETNHKYREKNSSLQELTPSKGEKSVPCEECYRSSSTPKTIQPQRSYVILPNLQKVVSHDSSTYNDTSLSTVCYCHETETDSYLDFSSSQLS